MVNMQTAYQYLFDIENTLRQIVQEQMQQAYGQNWERVAPKLNKRTRKDLDTLHFHDLICWFRIYPPLETIFPPEFISELLSIVPIRNKIAHCHMLTEVEFIKLQKVHHSIMSTQTISPIAK